MNKKENNRKNIRMSKKVKSIMNLAVPYVLIILFFTISVMNLGRVVINTYHEKILRDKQANIEVAFDRFLRRIDDVETLAYVISQSSAVTNYLYAGMNSRKHTVIDCMEVRDLLNNSWINDDVMELFLFDIYDNRIITPGNILSDANEYFRLIYQLEGYTTQDSLDRVKNFGRGCRYNAVLNGRIKRNNVQVIEYRCSLPINSKIKDVQGQLVFVMDAKKIFDDFYDVLGPEGEFYVYDENKNLIFNSGNTYQNLLDIRNKNELQLIDKKQNMYGIVCEQNANEWNVKVCVPLMEKNGDLLTTNIFFWVIFPAGICVLLCIYFTLKNHRELQEVLAIFGEEEDCRYKDIDQNEEISYDVVKEKIYKIVNEHAVFKKRVERYELTKKNEILEKIIYSTDKKHDEIKKEIKYLNLDINEGKCVVICIRYADPHYRIHVAENLVMKDLIKEFLGSMLEQRFELFDASARETVCILSVVDTEDIELILRDIVSRIKIEIAYNLGIEMQISVGGIVDSLYQINQSYIEAKSVIRHNENSTDQIYLYTDLIKTNSVYYYPKDVDGKIFDYVVLGKAEEARNVLKKVYKINFEECEVILSAEVVEALKSRVLNSLFSIAEKCGIHEKSSDYLLSSEMDIYEFFENAYIWIDEMCESMRLRKDDFQNKTANKIIDYVEHNFCDSGLSLKYLSQEFGLNETYISRLFRKSYGEKFSTVIENLRIKKACELIRETDMKINDVSKEVGYTSDDSFRRAFKKVSGVTPGEYRDV